MHLALDSLANRNPIQERILCSEEHEELTRLKAYCESMKEPSMKDNDQCLDSQLWHACAGGMVQMPAVNSKVYYFPQGHAEHAQGVVDFATLRRIPPLVLCRVTAVKFMADTETDDVFAKIRMVPINGSQPNYDGFDFGPNEMDAQEKPASFAKTLTQSDANNGGGFSVPRYCAETIFPRLDYSSDPPVQTVVAKDVHGEVWKFRHIYRGTPRRHLLTTGWSTFVNQKKLVAGDSIVFLRGENGDLCVGIRRAKRGGIGDGPGAPSGWNPPGANGGSCYGGFSVFLREEESKLMKGSGGNFAPAGVMRGSGRVRADSVIEAATLAASGQPFEVVYYPRATTPEFCVKAAAVKAAMRIQWCPGMRFKMAFETDDSSRISWFVGTISLAQVADAIRWPNSPWKLLQVTWDEPELLQNVKRVSPWSVELVSHMPAINLAHFSPPNKRPRIPSHTDLPSDGQFPTPMATGNPLGPSDGAFHHYSDGAPAGIQGARHAKFGPSLSDLQLNKLRRGLFDAGFRHATPQSRISAGVIVGNASIHHDNNVSRLLSIGYPSQSPKTILTGKPPPQLVLFGQTILTGEQVSLSKPKNTISPGSDGSGSAMDPELYRSLETGHCKVFMESEDVGRTLDLSVFGSYEELYRRLADMFGVEKSEMMMSHVLYKDAAGAVKHTGDEPFSDFMKTARRLTILTDSGS